MAWYVPSSHTDAEPFLRGLLHPWTPKAGILGEERILLTLPYIRTDEHQFVGELLLQRLGSSGKHRIDATHLVTYFPTALEYKVRYQSSF